MNSEIQATSARASRWIAWALCAVAGVAMMIWTWRRWPDVLVDFGGELYVPWRLAEGDVLYRDVAYFTGPLSPYLDAHWFRVFGARLMTLALANIAVIALIAALLLHLFERAADLASAVGATIVFLVLFAFAQLEVYGNSNYVTPYAHETTHGTLLALVAIVCLERWMRTQDRRWSAAIGLVLGLSFLTKVEYFLATAAACGIGIAGWLASGRARGFAADLGILVACMLVPPALAFGALCSSMSAKEALHGVLGAWPYVVDARITSLRFYTFVMGTDRPVENSVLLLQWLLPHAVVLGLTMGAAFALKKPRGLAVLAVLAASFVVTSVLLITLPSQPRLWLEAFRPLPLLMILGLAACLAVWIRERSDPERSRRVLLSASLCTFALVLIGKMILNARLQAYGYALAMPAMMVYCIAITGWIPRAIDARGGNGALFRGAAFGILAAAIVAHVGIMHDYFARKTIEVGRGGDRFLADARGTYVDATITALEQRMKPGETLAVLPEGVMINYLLRKRAPARYINYMPPELLMFGEERMLSDFEAHPPDWIVIAHKRTSEYGLQFFGQDYGQRLYAWIGAKYTTDATFGDPPLEKSTRFGLRILRRKR